MGDFKMLHGYKNRMQILASTYFLSEFVVNRGDYKEYSNHEFYNLIIQIFCFIMDKSLKGSYCFRENIIDFVQELNSTIYDKTLTRERTSEMVYYILRKGLRNDGYTYKFSFFDYDKGTNSHINVQLIDDEIVNVYDEEKTNYTLTERGYKLLFSTKEYDDVFQIEVTKFIAEMKIINGDYKSAKDEVDKLINLLEIQCQNIDSYIQRAKKNVSIIENEKYSDIVSKTFDILLSQQDKYSSLKGMVEKKLDLLFKEDINKENVQESIQDISAILKGLDIAISNIKKLHDKKHEFGRQFDELLRSMLFINYSGRFDFEKEITNKVEDNASLIASLDKVYRPLFKLQSPNIFSLHVPYAEQVLSRPKLDNASLGREKEEFQSEEEDLAAIYNEFYIEFMKEFIDFGIVNRDFTIGEFIENKKGNKEEYIRFTRYGSLIRDILLYFSHKSEPLDLEEIREELKKISEVNATQNFDILYIVSELSRSYSELPVISIEVPREHYEFFTSINKVDKTALKLTVPNIRFSMS